MPQVRRLRPGLDSDPASQRQTTPDLAGTDPKNGAQFRAAGADTPDPHSHAARRMVDEWMQNTYYGVPARPVLDDARRLYEWVVGAGGDDARMRVIAGPRLRIVRGAPANRFAGC